MRHAWLVLAACGQAAPPVAPAPRVELSTGQWVAACEARIQLAARLLQRLDPAFADGTFEIDPSPWNPRVRFDARREGDGYWQAQVEHGRGACIDFDTDDPAYNNMPWR